MVLSLEVFITRSWFVRMQVHSLRTVVDSHWEPHFEFVFRTFGAVTSVDDTSSKIDGIVSTDGTELRRQWLGLYMYMYNVNRICHLLILFVEKNEKQKR